MLDNAINSIRKERAALAREIEYMRESMEDDKLDEIMESVEGSDSKAELIEAEAYANSVDVTEEETAIESVEIDRILNADHDITFDEMIGL